nr:calcium homeostasis modulator protein 3 isoform X2 [Misgurnus anguillicaudatus]
MLFPHNKEVTNVAVSLLYKKHVGWTINRHTGVSMEEWVRPIGRRTKNPAVVKFLLSAVIQRSLLAPMVWILMTLLDGKCLICAFSMNVNPKYFTGIPNSTSLELMKILAKVSCKEDVVFKNSSYRKAVSRYVRCYSQAIGWSILLIFIFLGAVARIMKPCFNYPTFLQTRYWSNYLDVEQKLFDETCVLHARDFARKCVMQYFESMREDESLRLPLTYAIRPGQFQNVMEEEDDRLHGITRQDQVDQLLENWFECKPELDVTRMAYKPRVCITWEDNEGKALFSDV